MMWVDLAESPYGVQWSPYGVQWSPYGIRGGQTRPPLDYISGVEDSHNSPPYHGKMGCN